MERIQKADVLRTTESRLHALLQKGMGGDAVAYRNFLQATSMHLRAFLRHRLSRWPDEVEDLGLRLPFRLISTAPHKVQ